MGGDAQTQTHCKPHPQLGDTHGRNLQLCLLKVEGLDPIWCPTTWALKLKHLSFEN